MDDTTQDISQDTMSGDLTATDDFASSMVGIGDSEGNDLLAADSNDEDLAGEDDDIEGEDDLSEEDMDADDADGSEESGDADVSSEA